MISVADLPPPSTESSSPPMGNSPMSDAGGQAGHLRLSPLPNQQMGSQASDSVDLPPRTVVRFLIFWGVLGFALRLIFLIQPSKCIEVARLLDNHATSNSNNIAYFRLTTLISGLYTKTLIE